MDFAPRRVVKTGAVLLAAGAASRLGGRPKSLLALDGVPLIGRAIHALADAGVAPIIVVLGHYGEAIAHAVRGLPATLVRNPSPDDGQPASLRVGLQALDDTLDAVIVALADQPLIDADDIRALLEAFAQRADARMVVPRINGAPGNPVVIDATLLAAWRSGDAHATGRRWREAHPSAVHWFDTDNAHYVCDIDTPEDVLRFATRTGRTLEWPATDATHVTDATSTAR